LDACRRIRRKQSHNAAKSISLGSVAHRFRRFSGSPSVGDMDDRPAIA